MHACMLHGWLAGWLSGCAGWLDGRMDGWMCVCVCLCTYVRLLESFLNCKLALQSLHRSGRCFRTAVTESALSRGRCLQGLGCRV